MPQTATAVIPLGVYSPLGVALGSLPDAVVGTPYGPGGAGVQVAASGGKAPYSFAATGLPAGLTMSTTGLIAGTPTTVGTASVSITVTDSTAN